MKASMLSLARQLWDEIAESASKKQKREDSGAPTVCRNYTGWRWVIAAISLMEPRAGGGGAGWADVQLTSRRAETQSPCLLFAACLPAFIPGEGNFKSKLQGSGMGSPDLSGSRRSGRPPGTPFSRESSDSGCLGARSASKQVPLPGPGQPLTERRPGFQHALIPSLLQG